MVLRHTFSDLFSEPKVSGKLSSFQTYNQGPFAFVPFQNVQNLSCPPQPDSAPSFSPSASSSLLDVIRSSRWPSEKAKSRAAGKNRDTWVSAPATPQSVLTYATNLSLHIKEKLSRASRDFSAVTAAITSKRPKKKSPRSVRLLGHQASPMADTSHPQRCKGNGKTGAMVIILTRIKMKTKRGTGGGCASAQVCECMRCTDYKH